MKITEILQAESKRQQDTINLIASENYVSDNVKEALASNFTNKYAEGYPKKRYYGGTKITDELELAVIELAKKAFKTDYHVNVQPYSGSNANLAVYTALLNVGDPIMGLELSQGGHLTHGHSVSLSGKLFESYPYFVDPETGLIDYEQLEEEAKEIKPKLIISGASAYPRIIDFERISKIAHEVGALHMADISHISGLVVAGLHPTPFAPIGATPSEVEGYADIVTTTTHKLLRGPRGAMIFCKAELAEKIDKAVFPGLQGGPHLNNIAGTGVCLEEALNISYKVYCEDVVRNAKALADALKKSNFKLVSDGTDNHLVLIDLRPLKISGQEAQDRLEAVGIITNRNAIPYDEASPMNPSGIRIGTPAITTRGLKPEHMAALAEKIATTLK